MLLNDNIYFEKLSIHSFMVDEKLRLNIPFLFNLLQEVAVNHTDMVGCGWNYLHTKNQFWALSRMDVELSKRPKWHEEIKVCTWGKKHQFLIQPRDYLIEDSSGETIVRATSNWVILDNHGAPQTLDQYEHLLKNNYEKHAIEKNAARLRQSVHEENAPFFPVRHSNIDMNKHANNAAYIMWIMDSFSHQYHQTHELTKLSINYLQQTHANDYYAVMKNEIATNDFLCSIYSQKENIEVCRVRTLWEERSAE